MHPSLGMLALGLALFVGGGAAYAALSECKPPERANYVVFLNEPEFTPGAFASREEMLKFFDNLQFQLDQRRDLEMADLPDAPFRVARCVGRVPSIDGSDYTLEMVRSLYARRVVIEVWGKLDAERKGGKRIHPRAQINYLLTPLRKASDEGTANAPSLHRFNYPDGDIVAQDFVELVSNTDFPAFVIAAIGLRAYEEADFDGAHRYLCSAAPRLQRIEKRLKGQSATEAQAKTIGQLRSFLLERAARAIRQGGAQRAGLTALLSTDNPCGEQGAVR